MLWVILLHEFLKAMIRILLTSIFAAFCLQLTAQVVTVSEEIPLKNDLTYDLLGKMGNQILVLRDQTYKFEVQAFDLDLNLSWSKEIELDKRRPQIHGVMPMKEEFTVVYSYRNKNNTYLKAAKYDPAANLVDSVVISNLGNILTIPRIKIIRSEDKSKLLIYTVEQFVDMQYYVYDTKTMKVTEQRVIPLKDLKWESEFYQILVGNNGNVFIIFDRDNKSYRKEEHRFEVLMSGPDMTDLELMKVPMTEQLNFETSFSVDNLNKTLVAAGLYSDEFLGRANGIYFMKLDPFQKGSHVITFSPFADDFVTKIEGKDGKKKNKGLKEVNIQEVVHRKDGGILMICEKVKEINRVPSSGASYYSRTNAARYSIDHYYDDLFVVSIHANGQIHWSNILHKKQFSQDDSAAYSSFFLAKTPRNLRVVFNDNIRTENNVSEYTINGKGEVERNGVMSTDNQGLKLRFTEAIQISSTEIIVPSERRNRLKLVRIKY